MLPALTRRNLSPVRLPQDGPSTGPMPRKPASRAALYLVAMAFLTLLEATFLFILAFGPLEGVPQPESVSLWFPALLFFSTPALFLGLSVWAARGSAHASLVATFFTLLVTLLIGAIDFPWVTDLPFIHLSHLLLVLLAFREDRKTDTSPRPASFA